MMTLNTTSTRAAILLAAFSILLLLSCDSDSGFTSPEALSISSGFDGLKVGQEWRYAHWEKPHVEAIRFTGDTISVTVIAKDSSSVTLFEKSVTSDTIAPWDTATVKFHIEPNQFRLAGLTNSRVFHFLNQHDGVLILSRIDSNQVSVSLDTSLFTIREQLGKPKFMGHAERVELFSHLYRNVSLYYDQTPTYVDGFGHVAIFSRKEGVIATIYFGGFSPLEAYGYQLVE